MEGDHVDPSAPNNGAFNRVIESKVNELGGHKSLYSEAFYSRENSKNSTAATFPPPLSLPAAIKAVTDPDNRFPGLYEKTVDEA